MFVKHAIPSEEQIIFAPIQPWTANWLTPYDKLGDLN